MYARIQLRYRKPTRRLSLFCTVVLYILEGLTRINTTVQERYRSDRFWRAVYLRALVSQERKKTCKILHSSWRILGPVVFNCRSSRRFSALWFWIERMHGARVHSVSLTGIERSSLWTAGDAQEKLPSGTRSNFSPFLFSTLTLNSLLIFFKYVCQSDFNIYWIFISKNSFLNQFFCLHAVRAYEHIGSEYTTSALVPL